MKVVIPFEFELKQLAHSYGRLRGHYETFVVQDSLTTEVREVDPDEAPVAALIPSVQSETHLTHPVFRRNDLEKVAVRWFKGAFYVDQGPSQALDDIYKAWAEPHVGPFRRTRLSTTDPAKIRRRHASAFEHSKTRSKVEEAVSVIAQAVDRIIVVDGRVLERCPEPVRKISKSGAVGVGFAPETPGEETPLGSYALNYSYDLELAGLIDESGDVPPGVEVLMPEVFGGDIEPGTEMRSVRDKLAEIARDAPNLPLPLLVATRSLKEAIDAASMHPDERLVEAIEGFLAVGPCASEFSAMRAAYDYGIRRREHVSNDLLDQAKMHVEFGRKAFSEILPELKRYLAQRLYQGEDVDQILLPSTLGAVRRAQTKGEVFRAAVIAGMDPVTLFGAVEAGQADVVLIEQAIPMLRVNDGKYYSNGVTRGTIVGARITAGPGQTMAEHYTSEAYDEVKREAAEVDYPALATHAPELESKL